MKSEHGGGDRPPFSYPVKVGHISANPVTVRLEANARELNGVSFTKGCYVGQENTARMHHRSKVNRRLLVFHADGDPGDAARIYYPDLGLAVAQVRVEAIAPQMVLGGVAARPIVPTWLAEALAAPSEQTQ